MEEYKIDEDYLNVIYELRGKLLQTCIDLEMVMDSYIAEHFCESDAKVYELATIVLAPRIPWREKLAILSITSFFSFQYFSSSETFSSHPDPASGEVAPITNNPTPPFARSSTYATNASVGSPRSPTHHPAKCALIAIRFRSVTPRISSGRKMWGKWG